MGFEKQEKPVLHVNAGQFAELVQAHHNTVGNWIKAGMPVSHRKGNAAVIDLWAAIPWVRARDRQEVEEARNAHDPESARARKVLAEARLKEMELAEREGRTITVEEATAAGLAVADAVREALLGVAGAAVQAGLVAPEQEAALDALVRDALTALSRRPVKVEGEE